MTEQADTTCGGDKVPVWANPLDLASFWVWLRHIFTALGIKLKKKKKKMNMPKISNVFIQNESTGIFMGYLTVEKRKKISVRNFQYWCASCAHNPQFPARLSGARYRPVSLLLWPSHGAGGRLTRMLHGCSWISEWLGLQYPPKKNWLTIYTWLFDVRSGTCALTFCINENCEATSLCPPLLPFII